MVEYAKMTDVFIYTMNSTSNHLRDPETDGQATLYWNGSARAFTVTEVKNRRCVGIRPVQAMLVGEDEAGPRYVYAETSNPVAWYTLRKSGRWVRKGCKETARSGTLEFGHWDHWDS